MVLLLMGLPEALAVPSFARQTGMACTACHTVFPELTPFGREFKLNGYVLDNMKQIKGITIEKSETLALSYVPPLSAMLQVSYTHTNKAVPDSSADLPNNLAKDGDLLFPQQASLFYAGKIAEGLGAFVQLTFSGVDNSFAIDNTDIRYAHHLSPSGPSWATGKDLIFGLTLNNNPTVQDPWNTQAAWGFPYSASNVAPTQIATTILDTGGGQTLTNANGVQTTTPGGVGQNAGGLGAYLWWDNSVYAELTAYTASKVGGTHPLDSSQTNVIQGLAPYWRLGWENRWDRNSLFVGTYGISARVAPGGTDAFGAPIPLGGATNKFTDVAFDAQYQYIGEEHTFTVLGNYINEQQKLDASFANGLAENPKNRLNTFKLTGEYYYRRTIGGAIQFFNTTGSNDALLYPSGSMDPTTGALTNAVVGSATNSPNTRGSVLEVNYLPWLNVKLQLQYVMYSKFNGASNNYDGLGRNASDNNTLYLLAWFNF
jgi:hypothetical protein